ncbi:MULTISPECIES: 50S ribosomal protein L4 [unclassified Candidatus Lariskella]|uniref:50S ribosomal protein L4 n=1 Tax=unclassified Candidatus Lariskella TaxID=2632605 RepID=UPI0030CCB968
MKLDVIDLSTSIVEENIEVSDDIFGQEIRLDILHKMVTWQLAKSRCGDHSTKGVTQISGSTRKIYNQKGGGRARHGSNRAPQFRGGAVIFGPHTRSHEFKLNKKFRKLALKVALSLKYGEGGVLVSKDLKVPAKTSEFQSLLRNLNFKSVLIVDVSVDKKSWVAVHNLKNCRVLPVVGLNVLDVLKAEKVLFTVDAVKGVEDRVL